MPRNARFQAVSDSPDSQFCPTTMRHHLTPTPSTRTAPAGGSTASATTDGLFGRGLRHIPPFAEIFQTLPMSMLLKSQVPRFDQFLESFSRDGGYISDKRGGSMLGISIIVRSPVAQYGEAPVRRWGSLAIHSTLYQPSVAQTERSGATATLRLTIKARIAEEAEGQRQDTS
ncbi:hypothetical protein FMUND_13613 [Fusarium mundagurra]|uniref:Uncharacterized protein n=1 Tax=Fusarium mundagurra TaxID=1567541 RepID=A0A8H6D355_9HYPO|nr:hypothetical protein FMUND_13613 [Fusarium mundagurra]